MKRFMFSLLTLLFLQLHAEWKLHLDMKIPLPHLSTRYYAIRPVCWNSNGKKLYTTVDSLATSLGVIDIRRGLTTVIRGGRYPICYIAYKHSGSEGLLTGGMYAGTDKAELRLWDISAKNSEVVSSNPPSREFRGVASGPGDLWGVVQLGAPGQMYVLDGNKQIWHGAEKEWCLCGVVWNEYTGECIFGKGPLPTPTGAIAYNPSTHALRNLTSSLSKDQTEQLCIRCLKGNTFALVNTFPNNQIKSHLVQWGPHQTKGVVYDCSAFAQGFDINDLYVVGWSEYPPASIAMFDRNDLMNALCSISCNPNETVYSVSFNPRNEKQIAVGTDQAVYVYSLIYSDGPEAIQHSYDWPQITKGIV